MLIATTSTTANETFIVQQLATGEQVTKYVRSSELHLFCYQKSFNCDFDSLK